MPFEKGKFKNAGSSRSTVSAHHNSSTGEKAPPAKPMQEKDKTPTEGHGTPPEHVTKTHPGETQPHPQTGVHAFHAHHTGGGQYTSHTHHDGGDVQTQQHGSADEVHNAMRESLPSDSGQMGQDQNEEMGSQDFAETLGGIGGKDSY